MVQNTDRSKVKRGPDFLCIGMQKAGTKFLFDTLSLNQGFRLPLSKEIHHFDGQDGARVRGINILRNIATVLDWEPADDNSLYQFYLALTPARSHTNEIKIARHRDWFDETTVSFTRNDSHYLLHDHNDESYLALFDPYRRFICGDITLAYSTLQPFRIGEVR